MPEFTQLIPGKPPTDLSAARIDEVNALYKEFKHSARKTAMLAFKLGEALYDIKYRGINQGDSWQEFVEANFNFTYRTSLVYIHLYEKFQDCPEEIEDKTKSEAYAMIGFSNLAKEEKPPRERAEYMGDREQLELDFDIEELFSNPCLSKAKLENHRIMAYSEKNRLWLVTKNGATIPICQLYITPPAGLPDIEQKEALKNVQIALEKYFERIEEYERRGIISTGGNA